MLKIFFDFLLHVSLVSSNKCAPVASQVNKNITLPSHFIAHKKKELCCNFIDHKMVITKYETDFVSETKYCKMYTQSSGERRRAESIASKIYDTTMLVA